MHSPDRSGDDLRSSGRRSWVGGGARLTTLLTALTTLVLGGIAFLARVEVRPADGERREMRVIDIWREALRVIPAEAPPIFSQPVMALLLVAALVGMAYILVAILRLPR